jgi:hypothetical protein
LGFYSRLTVCTSVEKLPSQHHYSGSESQTSFVYTVITHNFSWSFFAMAKLHSEAKPTALSGLPPLL